MADDSIWYRIGYGLEQARHGASTARLRSLAERGLPARSPDPSGDGVEGPGQEMKDGPRRGGGPAGDGEREAGERDAVDALIAAGAGVLASRALGWWSPRREPGLPGLVKAGAAGAVAALLQHLVRPLVRGRVELPAMDEGLTDHLLSGAARGLIYASVVEPRFPGPPVARGAAYGSIEYLASPWGGLGTLLGKRSPHRRIPVVSGLFDPAHTEDDTWADHLVFSVALAALYGAVEEEVEVYVEEVVED